MKQFFTFLGIMAMGATAYGQADADIVNIPDVNFKRVLVGNTSINTDRDTEISYGEARAYTGEIIVESKRISNLTGIEAFVNIVKLDCSSNQLTSLDVGGATALKELSCSYNRLTSLDVSNNKALQTLFCYSNQLTQLNLANGKNTILKYMSADNNSSLQCIQIDSGFTPPIWWAPPIITYTAPIATI